MVVRMSKYTTEVRFICESKSGFTEDELKTKTPDQVIEAARSNIFDFSYPIYETNHKPELEKKILKHYYMREIAAETYALWKLWLNDTLNLIMPKYNKLYQAEALAYEKELYNVDISTHSLREDDFERRDDHTRTDNLSDATDMTRTDNLSDETDTTRTDNLTHITKDKYSDTPQGTVSNVDNDSYLTDYRSVTDTDTGTQRNQGTVDHTGTQRNAGTVLHTGTQRNAGSENNEGTQEITGSESGYRGSKTYLELIADYQEKVINIDMMIVNDLKDLFFKLW